MQSQRSNDRYVNYFPPDFAPVMEMQNDRLMYHALMRTGPYFLDFDLGNEATPVSAEDWFRLRLLPAGDVGLPLREGGARLPALRVRPISAPLFLAARGRVLDASE